VETARASGSKEKGKKKIYAIFMKDMIVSRLNSTLYRDPTWYQSFCGTHSRRKFLDSDNKGNAKTMATRAKMIFVQYPTADTNLNCIPSKMKLSPNDDAGLDAVVNILSHELIETVSGYDIGNLCVYDFGNIKIDSKGKQYTETMGSYNYFIQRNYNYKTGTCMNG